MSRGRSRHPAGRPQRPQRPQAREAREAREAPEGPPEDPFVVEISDSLDLHRFHPAELEALVDAYLEAALEAGFTQVRLIHGRGRGVQRARVARLLAADPRVVAFEDAPPGRGGWGATLAWLSTPESAASLSDGPQP